VAGGENPQSLQEFAGENAVVCRRKPAEFAGENPQSLQEKTQWFA